MVRFYQRLFHHSGMAFRIHDSVVRGEIDNRVKGLVRGKIWVAGRNEPVVLDLTGNAWPDLAGCLLTFTNPQQLVPHPHLDSLRAEQRGTAGDITASRKVRVFDVPLEDALAMLRRKEKPPEHLANSLYLEWYSERNGRVVVESADYALTISAPEWRLTAEENEERATQAAAGMAEFMQKLADAVEAQTDEPEAAEQPWDEQDYERFLKECDARTDKYVDLLEKYGDSPEAEAKIAEEMGWHQPDAEHDDELLSIEEVNALYDAAAAEPEPEPDPHTEGVDWIRTPDGDIRHPLQHRCYESGFKFRRALEKLGLEPEADPDLDLFVFEFTSTGTKLAGALNSIARGEDFAEPAFTVAYLKRALSRLHQAQAALEKVAPKEILPPALIVEARRELFEIREDLLRLMDHYRGR